MTLQGQLAQSAHSALAQTVPPFGDFTPPPVTETGLLGNTSNQTRVSSFDTNTLMEIYREFLRGVQPSSKLVILKRQRFTREGRQQRIEMSLGAVNAPQPTELTAAQWKEILDEIEDED
ncbi:MAG: hypothetical protein LAN70_05780 [Acidobacteriia bacterium]|nr:hypothetical protein [Terriglobia bacterium]